MKSSPSRVVSRFHDHESSSPSPAGRAWLVPGALFVLAVAIRLLPYRYVVLQDRIQFFGYDAYYHMRRIVYTLVHFPATLDFDLYMNFPEGARAIWTPVFDWMIAASIRPFYSSMSPRAVGLAASLVPPLLGAVTVVVLHRIARRHFGSRVAGLAALILALLPAHYWYSQIGFVDHHCAVALVTTLLLGAAMRALETRDGARGPEWIAWRSSLPLGFMLGAVLLVWPGTLLQVGLVEIALLATLLVQATRGEAERSARELAATHLVAFLVVAPLALGNRFGQWSDMSPVVLSGFQPWYFASATLFGAVCAVCFRWLPEMASSPMRRAVVVLASLLVIALGGLALWPSLLVGLAEAWAWVSRTDDFQALVLESEPLFRRAGRFSAATAVTNLSGFFLTLPFALFGLAVLARRSARVAPLWLLLFWTSAVSGMAVLQQRFANSASVTVALVFALSLVALADRIRTRVRTPRLRRLSLAILAAVSIGLLSPVAMVYAPLLAGLADPTGRLVMSGVHYDWYAMSDTADWIRRNTPHTAGWLDDDQHPEYGVIAPWDMGHILGYVGRRPTSTNNFGDDIGARGFLAVQEYFLADEPHAVKVIERLVGRYVVVPYYDSFTGGRPGPESMYRALYFRDGSEREPNPTDGSPLLPALERHRLVYEFTGRRPGDLGRAPYKVFEFVPGARVRGRAPAGAEVRARLDIETDGGRKFVYATRTLASPRGRYQLRVPYATETLGDAVVADDHYVIETGSGVAQVQVDELDVRRGRVVRGPDFGP